MCGSWLQIDESIRGFESNFPDRWPRRYCGVSFDAPPLSA
jgi:hypothetical protein